MEEDLSRHNSINKKLLLNKDIPTVRSYYVLIINLSYQYSTDSY